MSRQYTNRPFIILDSSITGGAGGDLTGTYPNPSIAANAVSNAKFRQSVANSLVGNPTGVTANVQDITLGNTLFFTGGILKTIGFTGDVSSSADSFNLTIDNDAITTNKILNSNVTLAKIANIATNRILGRTTAASGVIEELQLIGGTGITVTSNAGTDFTIATTITQYTDELAQDAVGLALTDTNSIDFTYNDVANQITADLRTTNSNSVNLSVGAGGLSGAVNVRNTTTANTSITGSGVGVDVNDNTSTQKISVSKNSAAITGTRKQINLIEGSNVTLTVADDTINDRVDITIASSGSSSAVDTFAYTYAGGF